MYLGCASCGSCTSVDRCGNPVPTAWYADIPWWGWAALGLGVLTLLQRRRG